MKIYCSRTYDLDYFKNKDLWVLCNVDDKVPITGDRYLLHLTDKRSISGRTAYFCEVLHDSNLNAKDNDRYTANEQRALMVRHPGFIYEDQIHLIYPLVAYTTEELFEGEYSV